MSQTEDSPQDKNESKFLQLVNSPFFLTFITGIFLAFMSSCLSDRVAENTQKREFFNTNLKLKITAMEKFASCVPIFLQTSIGMRKREIWLGKNQKRKKEPSLAYGDGRNFIETRNFYEKQRKEFNKITPADSICAYAKAVFSDANANIGSSIESLDSTLDTYMETNDRLELRNSFKTASTQYQDVIKLMGDHINSLKKEGQ